MPRRTTIPQTVRVQVLTEAGYRCAVPTCRSILALDIHHIVPVAENGPNEPGNLLVLCPTCHALFTRGTIHRDSIYTWKSILVSLGNAFDQPSVDDLLFLDSPNIGDLGVSGDGVLKFSRLVAAGLVTLELAIQNGPLLVYTVTLTDKGQGIVSAWKSGNRQAVEDAIAADPSQITPSRKLRFEP